MSEAWIFQRAEQVRDQGEANAPWYVGWYEPDGRRKKKAFGAGFQGKKRAERFKRKVEAELMTGTYQMHTRKLWPDFRQEYSRRILEGRAVATRVQANQTLDHFERIVKPIRVFAIDTGHIDDFIARRRTEEGIRPGELVSPYTVNKNLRHIKAALGVAVEWGYLTRLPRFHMEREPGRLPTYVTGEHFASIYQACEVAKMPEHLASATAADWWRGLLVMGYMTGWRISELLSLRRTDLNIEEGFAITRAEHNKAKRDEKIVLHPAVLEHLAKLRGFEPVVFPWNHNLRTLYTEFGRIQVAAGIGRAVKQPNRATRYADVYGFHDLRRAFATMNADKLTADTLQALMRHKSYQTTQKYINMARQMDEAVAKLHVPEVLRRKGETG
jgi:integrase